MIDAPDVTSTRPYLIRALYEWCTDNGFTPHVAVSVNDSVQVPREFVQNGEIVLNIGLDATSSLKLGNEFIEFKARFTGTAREIMVPVDRVMAIYARENGQGMAFPLGSPQAGQATSSSAAPSLLSDASATASAVKPVQLSSVESDRRSSDANDEPVPPRPSSTGARPALKRVK